MILDVFRKLRLIFLALLDLHCKGLLITLVFPDVLQIFGSEIFVRIYSFLSSLFRVVSLIVTFSSTVRTRLLNQVIVDLNLLLHCYVLDLQREASICQKLRHPHIGMN